MKPSNLLTGISQKYIEIQFIIAHFVYQFRF